ncbi:MAG: hypothetical protein GY756_15520 [bacterium]|nr:hypothetical protein [bacterium]
MPDQKVVYYNKYSDNPLSNMNYSDFRYLSGNVIYRYPQYIDGVCSCGTTFKTIWDSGHASNQHNGQEYTLYFFDNFEYIYGLKPGMTQKEISGIIGEDYIKSKNLMRFKYRGDKDMYTITLSIYLEKGKLIAIKINMLSGPCC